MKNIKKSQAGTTLLELMIVTMLSSFMMLTLLAVFSSFRGAWLFSQVQTDLYLDAQRAMDEMSRELMEGASGWTEPFTFLDPGTGNYMQGIWMASSRGNPEIAGEDGSGSNGYMHLDGNNVVSWRSAVVFCPYENSDGILQLRRYVDYGAPVDYYSGANIFPLTLVSVTASVLNFTKADGTILAIDRAGGRVLANYLGNEDADADNALDANENDGDISLPVDNADGTLNYGVNFVKNVGSVNIATFLFKEVGGLQQQGRSLSTTLRNVVKFRQP